MTKWRDRLLCYLIGHNMKRVGCHFQICIRYCKENIDATVKYHAGEDLGLPQNCGGVRIY